jgi:hypothetical protein
VVERNLAKVDVARSNRVTRFQKNGLELNSVQDHFFDLRAFGVSLTDVGGLSG